MVLPSFDDRGDLPPGVHAATMNEVIARFGVSTKKRRILGDRLRHIYELAAATGQLARFVDFGSFVTTKLEPNDVDVVILMENSFELSLVSGDTALLFRHLEAEVRFGASVFWSRRCSVFGEEQDMIEYWQIRRDGGRRGIVEIAPEKP